MILPRKALCAGLSVFALTAAASAQSEKIEGDAIVNLRLRTEYVDQDGLDETTALTLGGRFGYEIRTSKGWSALVEGEAVGHLTDEFSDTINTVPGKAVIADPEAFELNRLQIAWKGEDFNATIGRQRIIFDDARFVGNVGFRQNEQTFDALRLGITALDNITLDYVYIEKVHRIFGDDSPVGEFESDSHVIRVGAKTGAGDLVATVLLLDFDNAPSSSSQTYAIKWSKNWDVDVGTLGLSAQFALQGGFRGGGPSEDLGFQSYGVAFTRGDITAFGGLEVLEGSGGQGFATPLATLHAFQGWADVFLSTPAAGIRDLSIGLRGKGLKIIKGAKPASWALIYHNFDSDNGAISYGSEFDAVFRMPINNWFAVETKGAVFDGAIGGPSDRKKLWLALETSF